MPDIDLMGATYPDVPAVTLPSGNGTATFYHPDEIDYAASPTSGGNATKSNGILYAAVDSTSTSTVFTATVDGLTSLYDGVAIMLHNGVVTSAKNFTINVNGLGAKKCYSSLTNATRETTIFNVAYTLMFVYSTALDGGNGGWWVYRGIDTNTTYTPVKLGFGYGHCTTAAATAAKAVAISSYVLNTGGIVSVLFDNDVPAGATLNVTSKGAKAIYHKGAAIADGIIKAGDTATFMYSTQYHLVSVDRDAYTLPPATASTLGGVKVGDGLSVAADGTASIADDSITDSMLAPDGIKPQVAQLWGNQLTGELTGDLLIASDAYAAPPMALVVDGRSTQDSTPAPDALVPIESVVNPALTFAGKNLLDVGKWERDTGSGITLVEGDTALDVAQAGYQEQRNRYMLPARASYTLSCDYETISLTNSNASAAIAAFDASGARIALTRLYLRSVGSRGSATLSVPTNSSYLAFGMWTYGGHIIVRNLQLELGSTATDYEPYNATTVPLYDGTLRSLPDGTKDTLALTYLRPSTREGWAWYARELVQAVGMTTTAATDGITGTVGVDVMSTTGEIADGTTVLYKLATPVTTQLDPIELPALPAPTCTVWADPITGLQMKYVQDTNIVIAELRAALADLATS